MYFAKWAAAAAVLVMSTGAANAAAFLYGIDNDTDSLVTINTLTGEVTAVGATNPTTPSFYNYIGMTVAADGAIYVTDQNGLGADGGLVVLDRTTGAELSRISTNQASSGFSRAQTGIAFDENGVLYSTQSLSSAASLNTIDTATGVVTTIDSLAEQIIGGDHPTTIDFSPDGVLYGYDNKQLLTIDKATGDVQYVGGNLADIYSNLSIAFAPDGTLYATTRGFNDYLLTIDPLTGAVLTSILLSSADSSLGLAGIAFYNDGAVAPPSEVPLPAAAFLFAPFAAGLMRLRRRKAA